ncbi:MAG: HTTM domain-containing protein, partial [Flavobacteriales bacterium]|nr:HTTM domain-containing protein [Flavobacteriales bacterium]
LQLAIVYFYAGLAKLNYDWIVNAMPLRIWLPSKSNIPLIGGLLQERWLAYFFSWFGASYDLLIPFLLFIRRTRPVAYFLVIVFHLATYFLFQIGMFPFIMIGATLIFFSEGFHLSLINWVKQRLNSPTKNKHITWEPKLSPKWSLSVLSLFFLIQLSIPFRSTLYPGNLYWTEQGYRFSWRVMLMEKAGYAIFHVTNPENGRNWEVNNYDFLTPNQEKMMSTQPDMILQFALLLEQHYRQKGIQNPKITAEVYVTLNGKQSQLFIDPTVDLTQIKDSFAAKKWILPFDSSRNE